VYQGVKTMREDLFFLPPFTLTSSGLLSLFQSRQAWA